MQTVHQLLNSKSVELFHVGPKDSVLRAIEVMATKHVGALMVLDKGALVGVISERDYARKVVLMNRASHDTPVEDIMSAPAITVSPDDSVRHCMELMTNKRIRHLPVVKEGRVIGILSIGDLVKAVIEDQSHQIAELQKYIAG
ncbi:MAG: CBS domain-containing protein [Steroidobacteraceae bacterium]|jgi:CBS domain-containing protein